MTANIPEESHEKKKCVVCGSEVSRDEKASCPVCHFNPDGMTCNNCKKRIPMKAVFCNECKTYQGVRQYFNIAATVLSLMLASFAVINGVYLAATYLSDRNSHTRLKVTGAEQNLIYLKVWNTGRKPSTLVTYRLKFDGLPKAKELTLQQFNETSTPEAQNLILPGKDPVTISLGLPIRADLPEPQRSKQYSDDELGPLKKAPLGQISAVLEVDVEESDDEGTTELRQDHFRADRIEKLMRRLIQ